MPFFINLYDTSFCLCLAVCSTSTIYNFQSWSQSQAAENVIRWMLSYLTGLFFIMCAHMQQSINVNN